MRQANEDLAEIREQIWVLRAQRGDAAAFRQLVDAYERKLLYFVRRFVRDATLALDVMQDVWLAVFRRLAGLREPRAFRVWLYQIAHDQVVRFIRRERRQAEVHADYSDMQSAESIDELAAIDNAELVHRALELLSPEHREVLTLRFLEDMSIEEIAETVRCSLGTVKSRLHYAKRAMRQRVEESVP